MRPSERKYREMLGTERDTGPGHERAPEHHTRGNTGMGSSHGGRRARGFGRGMEPRFLTEEIEGYNRGRGPREYQRSDERIYEDVCEALTLHDWIDAREIQVSVEDGEVTLEGTVDSRWIKHVTEDLADEILGVREIHNRLRVSG